MTADEARTADLEVEDVARLLRLSASTVRRIPDTQLDFWRTPGRHRRYRREDVERYARDVLGVELEG
jgi:excisionase family DNA binding protein